MILRTIVVLTLVDSSTEAKMSCQERFKSRNSVQKYPFLSRFLLAGEDDDDDMGMREFFCDLSYLAYIHLYFH